MTAVTFSFDGTASTTVTGLVVRDIRRPILGERRDRFVDVPGRSGSFLFEEKAGDREIKVDCAISAADSASLRTPLATLAALLDKSGQCMLIFSDQSDRFWLARLEEFGDPKEERGYAEFDLVFRCDPFAYATSASTQQFLTSTTEPYTNTWSVTTVDDTPPIIDITPTGGNLTNGFVLTVNGDALTYGETLASGSTLRISSVSYTASIASALSMANLSGAFGQLINGTNSITLDRASGTAATTIDIQWRRRYV